MKGIDDYLKDLSSERAKVKYGASRKLLSIAQTEPAWLYSRFDSLVKLWDSDNRILKWTGIRLVGCMARVDTQKKIDRKMKRLFSFLDSGELITANNAISALGELAECRPGLRARIVRELLKVEGYRYDTAECRNIAVGKVVLVLARFADELGCDRDVREFLKRQTRNRRSATRKKALQALERMKPCCSSCG